MIRGSWLSLQEYYYYIIILYYINKALSVCVLEEMKEEIKNKRVVCILSGGTVDLSRFDEFKEHSLLYEGLKYFFLIQMPLKPGILKNFVTKYLLYIVNDD